MDNLKKLDRRLFLKPKQDFNSSLFWSIIFDWEKQREENRINTSFLEWKKLMKSHRWIIQHKRICLCVFSPIMTTCGSWNSVEDSIFIYRKFPREKEAWGWASNVKILKLNSISQGIQCQIECECKTQCQNINLTLLLNNMINLLNLRELFEGKLCILSVFMELLTPFIFYFLKESLPPKILLPWLEIQENNI